MKRNRSSEQMIQFSDVFDFLSFIVHFCHTNVANIDFCSNKSTRVNKSTAFTVYQYFHTLEKCLNTYNHSVSTCLFDCF